MLDLLHFKRKLLEIREDVDLKIIDTDLLIKLYDCRHKTVYNSVHELAEFALKINRLRFDEIIEGKKMSKKERLDIIDFLNNKEFIPTIKENINNYVLFMIKLFGNDNAFKFLGISQRSQQRYLKVMRENHHSKET